jgi:sugar O-acyltransferase (sialic acid O-acetyltransferase NeuD family)
MFFSTPTDFNDYSRNFQSIKGQFVILGKSGLAMEILSLLESWEIQREKVKFVDKSDEHDIVSEEKLILGMGSPRLRKVCHEALKQSWNFPIICHPKVNMGSQIEVGDATLIQAGVSITTEVMIGDGCLLNLNSTIGHGVKLGDYVSVHPGATISGNVIIGSETLVGANSTILQDITIGSRVIIGAGAVVTRSVPDGQTVVGVPAKRIKG